MKFKMASVPVCMAMFLAFHLFSYAQEYYQTVRGKVIEKQTRMPLPGANVLLLNSSPPVGAVADMDGNFRIEKVPIGRQGVQVSYLGYNTVTLNELIVTTGKEVVLLIEMEEKVYKGEEVVIIAEKDKEKPLNKMATVSARAFNIEETMRYAGSWGDPARMASNFAGVGTANDQRNDIVIRGNSPAGVLWRLDGINIPNPNHFGMLGTTGGPVPILNSNLLDDSDFLTGAFPAEFGNALAGVFDVKMRTGNNEKREYIAQMGLNGFELGAEGPISHKSKASYLANYRYSTMGIFKALGISFGVSGVPQYQDLSFKIDFPGTKHGRLSVFGIGGKSHIDLLDSERDTSDWSFNQGGSDIYFYSDMGVVGISHLSIINNSTNLKFSLAASGNSNAVREDSVNKTDNKTYLMYRNNLADIKYSANVQLNKKFSAKDFITSGIIADLLESKYIDSARAGSVFIKFHNTHGKSALIQSYAQWQHKFTDLLVFNIGLHHQLFTLNNSSSVEPRFGVSWNFAEKQHINFGTGLHSQIQPMASYFYQTKLTDGSYIKTNKKIDLTKSIHLILGYDYIPFHHFRSKIETYYQYLYDVPVEPTRSYFSMLNVGGDFSMPDNDSLVNKGTGYNYGVEFTFEKFFGKNYYFLVTASLSDSKYKGSDGALRNTAFNGTYTTNLLGGYELKLGKKSYFVPDGKLNFSGGKRYIQIDLEKSKLYGDAVYDFSEAYEKKFNDYFRFDIEISYRLNGKKITQEWTLSIQNVTGNKNILTQTYDNANQAIRNEYQLGVFPVGIYRMTF